MLDEADNGFLGRATLGWEGKAAKCRSLYPDGTGHGRTVRRRLVTATPSAASPTAI